TFPTRKRTSLFARIVRLFCALRIPWPRLLPSAETESHESSCAITSRRIGALEVDADGTSVAAGSWPWAGVDGVLAGAAIVAFCDLDSLGSVFPCDDTVRSETGLCSGVPGCT